MNVFYLGEPPTPFTAGKWPVPPLRLGQEPLFHLDALFIFAADLTYEERRTGQLVERI